MKRRTETLELEETGSSPVERLTYTVQRPVLGAPKPYPIRRPSAGGDTEEHMYRGHSCPRPETTHHVMDSAVHGARSAK